VKQSEDFDEPYDQNNHHNAVKDSLNLTLHGDKAIDQPKQYADCADRQNNRDEWHLVYSNSFLLFQSEDGSAELHCSLHAHDHLSGIHAKLPLST
jgi:hypothetical protein